MFPINSFFMNNVKLILNRLVASGLSFRIYCIFRLMTVLNNVGDILNVKLPAREGLPDQIFATLQIL